MNSVEIKRARNGKGIFASRPFKKNELVYEVRGKIFDTNTIHSLNGYFADNCFRYDTDLYLQPEGETGNYQNHSCVPNSRIAKTNKGLYVHALSDIKKGDEITIDYSTIVADDDVVDGSVPYELKCNCGEDRCRGVVRNFSSLPIETRSYYLETNAVPEYVLEFSKY